MKPAPFRYLRPGTLEEALDHAAQFGEDALLLAGGQSLVPMMNLRLARAGHVVDLNALDALAYIERRDGELAIGSMTRQASVEHSSAAGRDAPLVVEVMPHVAYPAIRSRGTIGGSLALADPQGRAALRRARLRGHPRAHQLGRKTPGAGARVLPRTV